MAFSYQPPDSQGRLCQGEIISNLQELQHEHPGKRIVPDTSAANSTLVEHPLIVVLTPDCDLLTDFLTRRESGKDETKLLQHVQCCDVYEESEIKRTHQLPSDLWKRVRQNQNERYHQLPQEQDDVEGKTRLPTLYLDFKRMFSVPAEFLYRSLESGGAVSKGVIPPIWLHSLIHRYFTFHSRIGVPDPEDKNR